MLIGVMSDSHDDMGHISLALELFKSKNVQHVIHAGDLCSPFTFDVLGRLGCPFTGIFGNNDGDRLLIKKRSEGNVHVQPHALELAGRRIVIVHEPTVVDALAASGKYDLVIYGHTHVSDVRREGACLVVNPGKTAALHKGSSTVALIDLVNLQAELVGLK